MSDPGSLVRVELGSPTATITLDSPQNRNALSRQLVAELSAALRSAAAESEIRVVVLTHTGTTFCAGADLSEAIDVGMESGTRSLLGLLRQVVEHPKPVVAAVDGHVRAGGVGLVGACDLAVVTAGSTFAFTEARLGLAPAIISLTTQTRLTDRDAANKYLTGAAFDGQEAARCGLVTRAVPDGELPAAVAELLGELAASSPQGLRETKRLLTQAVLRRFDEMGEDLVQLSAQLFGSAEAGEGMSAFRQRRPPAWNASRELH